MASSTNKAGTTAQSYRSPDYPKRGGVADTVGQDYEVDICSLLFLRALRLCSDFYLASNHGDAGAFDDAVMVYRLHGEDKFRAILLQAKHKKNSKVTLKTLTGPKNDFSLVKYFSSFLEVSDGWTSYNIGGKELELQEVVYALYTNAGADLGAAAEDVRDRQHLGQLLLTGGSVVQISYERIKDALSSADPSQLEDFLGRLVLCYGQMSHVDANSYLDDEIRLILNDQPGNVIEIRNRITEIVRDWWAQPTDTSYLTKNSALCPVNLQGTRMSLEIYDPSVAEAEHIRLLARRPEGEEVKLGLHLLETVPYYVPRVLERKAFLEESFFTAVRDELAIVAVVGVGKEQLQGRLENITSVYTYEDVQQKQSVENTVIVLLPEDNYNKVFSEMLGKFECKIYLLNFTEGEFLCVENRRGLSTVRNHVKDKISDMINSVWDTSYRNVIVEGLPGMGKSCLMSWVGEQVKAANPVDWVLRVDLGRLSDKIQQRDFQRVEDIKDFLAEACLTNKSHFGLEKALFCHALQVTGNVTILLDAFDEVSPDYTDKCLRLLQGLTRSVKYRQMVVTTRPVTSRDVEDVLGTLAFTLRSFSEDNAISLFEKYHKSENYDRDSLEISTVIKSVGQCFEIPLLAFMAAEGLFHDEYIQLGGHKRIMKVKLYHLFVEKQIRRILFDKRDLQMLESDKKVMLDIMTNSLNEDLINLALETMLNVEEQQRFGFKEAYDRLRDSKLGLVVCNGDRVDFIHRTFAEFFLGMWLARRYKDCRELLLKKLFGENFELVRESFDSFLYRECPLHTAVAEGDLPEMDRLLAEGLQVSSVDAGGRTPLHVAVLSLVRDSEVWNLLTDADAVIGQKDAVLQWSALTYAEAMSNWDAVGILLGKGASVEDLRLLKEKRKAKEMLVESCRKGYVKISLAILKIHKRLLNKNLDWQRSTALHLAAESGSLPLVRALIDAGADLNPIDGRGLTPVSRAAEEGHVDVIDYLKNKGASMEAGEETPLEVAVANGRTEIIKYLVYGGEEEYRETDINSALIKASSNNEDSRIMELLENGADIEHRDEYGMTALHWVASLGGSVNVVEALLKFGAKVNAIDNIGITALMLASRNGHIEIVQLILRGGADVNMANNCGTTALTWASQNGHTKIVQLLLKEEADVNMANNIGDTSLLLASYGGHSETVQLLLREGADVNMRDNRGNTALMWASENGHTKIVQLLLREGADVNMGDNTGYTALMLASYDGHSEIVQLLIRDGADVNMGNNDGKTALMLASKNSHTETKQLLICSGAVETDAEQNWTREFTRLWNLRRWIRKKLSCCGSQERNESLS